MTLLTTAQNILKETKSATIPTTIIGNVEDTAVQVLQALTVSITNLARTYEWQQLQKEHTFATVASTQTYSLPVDFDRLINNTFWNSTTMMKVIGAISPQEWRVLTNSTANNSTIADYYRLRANLITLFPTPSGVENFVLEYISSYIVESSGGSGQTGWEADTDVPVLDEYLLRLDATWRLLKMQGRPYGEEQKDADLAIAERLAVNGSKKTIVHFDNSSFRTNRIGYPTTVVG
jgi:hypothetical protein